MATAATNKKKVLVTETFSAAGMALLKERSDVEILSFPNAITSADFNTLLKQHAPVHAVALGGTPFGENELNSSGDMRVVTRIGVGFDAVDIPSLNKRKIPLMTTGIANSPSVAEAALFMMLALAKRGAELDALVKENRWSRPHQDHSVRRARQDRGHRRLRPHRHAHGEALSRDGDERPRL